MFKFVKLFLLCVVIVATSLLLNTQAFAQEKSKVRVVVSFSILADMVAQVGGERVQVNALVGHNSDMHAYSPKPSDVKMLLGAPLVIINGLGFEPWADKLLKSADYKGFGVVASKGVKALAGEEEHGDHKHGHSHKDHGHGAYDPHAWQDLANAQIYVKNITEALVKVDPQGEAYYLSNSRKYLAQLSALDAQIKADFAKIPVEKRKVMTSHEAFAYFGEAYDVRFIAPQGSSSSAPSAKVVAKMIDQIRREKISAVFVENIADKKVIEKIAQEGGARVGGTLYADALGGSITGYVQMMEHNYKAILSALQ